MPESFAPKEYAAEATSGIVVTNMQTSITATVTDQDDNPLEGYTVAFTYSGSSGGSLSASTAITDSSGEASITYTAGATGSLIDTVSARIGNAIAYAYISVVSL